MILFCLPYAGGSQVIYYKWKKHLSKSITLYPIELKGRGSRINENLYSNVFEAVEDILNEVKSKIQDDDYAIFGHSMGSILAYELYHEIKKRNLKEPNHMFFSGQKPPSIARDPEKISELCDNDFIKKVIDLGGTPNEILEDKDILKLFIPILKADFKILETYEYNYDNNKIDCNISIFNGKKDNIKIHELIEWTEFTNKNCKFYEFNGGHFFINDETQAIIDIINYTLCP